MNCKAPLYYINGRFLSKKITGTERFGLEIVRHLDNLLCQAANPPRVILVAPRNAVTPPWLSHIEYKVVGDRTGHAWEQTNLWRATADGFLINLCASGPLFKRDQITVIHDAAIYRHPKNFSFAYRVLHYVIDFTLARFSRLGTVSEFSRQELAAILRVDEKSITVIPNGHEHILKTLPDTGIIARLGLEKRPYFLFVGSPTPNKNLANAIKAFQQLPSPDAVFVIVGGINKALFNNDLGEPPANVLMPGRLTDEEVVGLFKAATAFVFPSIYEGFGIPPLEAMAHGCPVIASKIPAVEEVCGDSADYFAPLDPQDIAAKMQSILSSPALRKELVERGKKRLEIFSWRKSAERLMKYMLNEAGSAVLFSRQSIR